MVHYGSLLFWKKNERINSIWDSIPNWCRYAISMCHKLWPTARHVAIRRQGTGAKSLQRCSSINEIPPQWESSHLCQWAQLQGVGPRTRMMNDPIISLHQNWFYSIFERRGPRDPMVSNATRRFLVLVLALHATVHVGGRRLWRPGCVKKIAQVHQPPSAGVNMA